MWTGTVVHKEYKNGVLLIFVQYENGQDAFTESVDITGSTIDFLNSRIQTRLKNLNATEKLLGGVDVAITSSLAVTEAKLEEPPWPPMQ